MLGQFLPKSLSWFSKYFFQRQLSLWTFKIIYEKQVLLTILLIGIILKILPSLSILWQKATFVYENILPKKQNFSNKHRALYSIVYTDGGVHSKPQLLSIGEVEIRCNPKKASKISIILQIKLKTSFHTSQWSCILYFTYWFWYTNLF